MLSADERVLAAYLVGGFAVGMGDAFSDVDLQIIVAKEAAEDVADSWVELIHRIAPTVWIQPFSTLAPGALSRTSAGGLCITPEWMHFDVVFRAEGEIDAHAVVGMVPLFDKAALLRGEPVPRADRRTDPFYPEVTVNFFLYMIGNVVSAIGRDEPVPASNGVIMMRDVGLVGLLLAEQGWATTREHNAGNPFPFTKRLRRYLTDEQNALLESLPALSPTIDSAIDGYVALIEILPAPSPPAGRGTSFVFPEAYARAGVAYFERSLGARITV